VDGWRKVMMSVATEEMVHLVLVCNLSVALGGRPHLGPWLACAFLIGFGTGASNTVASLFVVEFTPKDEWSERISWLQTFNALGLVLGMAIASALGAIADGKVANVFGYPAVSLCSPRSVCCLP
jgi:fucose permease